MSLANLFDDLMPSTGPVDPTSWAERHGGALVSLAVGIATYAWLVVTVYQPVRPVTNDRVTRIVFRPVPPPPEIAEPAPQEVVEPVLPELSEVAATSANPSENAPLAEAIRVPETVLAAVRSRSSTLAAWRPETEGDRQLVESLREQVTRYGERLDANQNDLKADINRLAIEAAGREFLLNTDGGRAGVIRTFDFKGYPPETIKPLLSRYGIRIEYKHVNPDKNARPFLNSATFEDGTFTNVQREGYYEVLVFSPKAVALMATKELTALYARGFEPRDARVRKIVFGIVQSREEDFDLDVIDMEVERLR